MASTHVDIEQAEWTPGTPFYVAGGALRRQRHRAAQGAQRPSGGGRRHRVARQIFAAAREADQDRRNRAFRRACLQSRRRPRDKIGRTGARLGRLHAKPDRPAAQRHDRGRNGQPHRLFRRAGPDRVNGSHRCQRLRRSEDFGFIAERDGTAIGAAWARQFARYEQPAFFVDGRTPEITVGVKPQTRGRGVGRMLHALIGEAARRSIGVCLNVRHDNPARRLYERVGFRLVPGSGVPNRVGGTSFGMLWAAPRSADAASHHLAISRRSRESRNPVSDKAAAVSPVQARGRLRAPAFAGETITHCEDRLHFEPGCQVEAADAARSRQSPRLPRLVLH
jgi:GNAT superfamily N-acetyltransferase